jgi:hypothetical protein
MTDYTIYFELFGKKMKTTIRAKSRSDAMEAIKDKIVFHKIVETDSKADELRKIFGI